MGDKGDAPGDKAAADKGKAAGDEAAESKAKPAADKAAEGTGKPVADKAPAGKGKPAGDKAGAGKTQVGVGKKAAEKKGANPWALRIAVIALALSVGFLVWAVTRDDDEGPAPAPVSVAEQAEARIVSEEELADLATTVGHPIYWVGPIPETELEVAEIEEGSILVRYLEDGAGAGEGQADFLAVGSYSVDDAEGAIKELAAGPDAIVRKGTDGREVVTTKSRQTNVYFADSETNLQIEVFDPSPKRAMELAQSDQIEPIG